MTTLEVDAKNNNLKRLAALAKINLEKEEEKEKEEDEPGEEEEIPDSIKNLPEDQQQRAIITLSFKTMMTGLVVVILFSDPMVGVLSAFGKLIGIKPF